MDDLNIANVQPAAALPPEATADNAESPVVQSPAAEALPERTSPPVQEQAASQPETPAEVSAPAETAAADVKPAKKGKPTEVEAEEKPEEKSDKMDWYILKVQSNREESIREGLLRRVNIAGLGFFFDQVIVPTEKVTEFKGGKKKVIKRKLYPGYLVVHMEINDDTWFLVRETPGIGDFTGAAGRPSPMLPHEVSRIVAKQEEKSEKAPKLKIAFREGERVKIKEGTFENFEGDVESIDETNGRVTVMINIFGRSTPVELEYWQIETL
jgi:transcriptional antiterminator NusG